MGLAPNPSVFLVLSQCHREAQKHQWTSQQQLPNAISSSKIPQIMPPPGVMIPRMDKMSCPSKCNHIPMTKFTSKILKVPMALGLPLHGQQRKSSLAPNLRPKVGEQENRCVGLGIEVPPISD